MKKKKKKSEEKPGATNQLPERGAVSAAPRSQLQFDFGSLGLTKNMQTGESVPPSRRRAMKRFHHHHVDAVGTVEQIAPPPQTPHMLQRSFFFFLFFESCFLEVMTLN